MGVVSCSPQESTKQIDIHQEIKKQGNIVAQKEIKTKNLSPHYTNKSNKNVFYNKLNNDNSSKENKNNINNNQRRKTYTKKDETHQYKQTKQSSSKKKNRNTISHNYKMNSKTLINDSRLKKNILNSSIRKKKENKNNRINYNIYTNIYNDLSEEDKIIYNNDNEELDDNVNLYDSNITKINNNQYKDLKEKLMKAKEQIIKIKKDLYTKEKSSVNEEINMSINKEKLTTIEIYNKSVINSHINNSIDNINVGNKNIINNKINNNNIDKSKINNTIFINNSNITISNNRSNNLSQDNLKEIKEKNIELNDLLTNVLNNNSENKIESINKQFRIQSDLDLNFLKSNNLEYLSQSNDEIIDNDKHDKNEKIINKLTSIKKKINKEITPPKRKTYPIFGSKKIKKFNTMNNKQIKNNIPTYRRGHSQSNNFYLSVLNSSTYDSKKKRQIIRRINIASTENSINNRSLGCSKLKARIMNINKYTINNKTSISPKKNNEKNNRNSNAFSKKSLQQSYINESSISAQNNNLNLKINKDKKNQRLYNFISKNIINNNSYNQNSNKEYEHQKILLQNGEVIIIDLSPINLNESLINKDLLKDNISNKMVLDYNKLDGLNTSQIIYDGLIYKVVESKENGYKLIERYFQLLKNCFRYYNNLENATANKDKPLVQFDIRHIKEINIINISNDIFKKYKIKEKKVEFVFCIFLYQNDDFFVFACNNKEIGNSIYNIINLLKNYYARK